MALEIKLEAFEGPLDLLLHLIEKNKIDIYDIPISDITDQYMEYVRAMRREDMDLASEFMVMAATLIDIKCRMLLPKEKDEEGEEIDPREDLVKQLIEHKEFRAISEKLRSLSDEAGDVVTRPETLPPEVARFVPEVDTEELLDGLTLSKMREIFEFVMKRQADRIDPVRSRFGHIEKEQVSLPDKLDYVEIVSRRKRRVSFRTLLKKQTSRMQVIVTFLAVLELMKLGRISCVQNEAFGDIEIESREDVHDTSLAGDAYRESGREE